MKLRICSALFCLLSFRSVAQTDSVTAARDTVKAQFRPSPVALAFHKTDNCYLKLTYGQPLKKGRVIFGNLEPYGKIWRTGANEATEFTVTRDIRFAGKPLRQGTYTLFTIPNEKTWTIILNTELGQWGAFHYQPEKDYLRVDVPADLNNQVYEALTFRFEETETGANLHLMWDTVKVVIPLAFAR